MPAFYPMRIIETCSCYAWNFASALVPKVKNPVADSPASAFAVGCGMLTPKLSMLGNADTGPRVDNFMRVAGDKDIQPHWEEKVWVSDTRALNTGMVDWSA